MLIKQKHCYKLQRSSESSIRVISDFTLFNSHDQKVATNTSHASARPQKNASNAAARPQTRVTVTVTYRRQRLLGLHTVCGRNVQENSGSVVQCYFQYIWMSLLLS